MPRLTQTQLRRLISEEIGRLVGDEYNPRATIEDPDDFEGPDDTTLLASQDPIDQLDELLGFNPASMVSLEDELKNEISKLVLDHKRHLLVNDDARRASVSAIKTAQGYQRDLETALSNGYSESDLVALLVTKVGEIIPTIRVSLRP